MLRGTKRKFEHKIWTREGERERENENDTRQNPGNKKILDKNTINILFWRGMNKYLQFPFNMTCDIKI